MTSFPCPHCGKSVGLSVVGHQDPNPKDPPPMVKTETPHSTKPAKGKMVNTEMAKSMRSGINIEGRITHKGGIRTVNKKTGGTIDLCDCVLEDDVGKITVQLWGSEINSVKEGNTVRFENAYTNSFKGDISLAKGKYGKMEILA